MYVDLFIYFGVFDTCENIKRKRREASREVALLDLQAIVANCVFYI